MVSYYFQDVDFKFNHRRLNNAWLKLVAESEVKKLGAINIIFCSDAYILDVNMKYLQHDYFTDIITFDYCEKNILSGDLFISVDSVRENAFSTILNSRMNSTESLSTDFFILSDMMTIQRKIRR